MTNPDLPLILLCTAVPLLASAVFLYFMFMVFPALDGPPIIIKLLMHDDGGGFTSDSVREAIVHLERDYNVGRLSEGQMAVYPLVVAGLRRLHARVIIEEIAGAEIPTR